MNNQGTIKNIHNHKLGIFSTSGKSSRQTIVRQIMLMITIMITTSQLKADITFKGICGSYSYDFIADAERYYTPFCKDNSLYVYYNNTYDSYIYPVHVDMKNKFIFPYEPNRNKVTRFITYEGDIKYVGTNAGLTMVLAGTFIGFTILFFTSFLFIEVVKK